MNSIRIRIAYAERVRQDELAVEVPSGATLKTG